MKFPTQEKMVIFLVDHESTILFIFGDPRNPNHRDPNHQAKPLVEPWNIRIPSLNNQYFDGRLVPFFFSWLICWASNPPKSRWNSSWKISEQLLSTIFFGKNMLGNTLGNCTLDKTQTNTKNSWCWNYAWLFSLKRKCDLLLTLEIAWVGLWMIPPKVKVNLQRAPGDAPVKFMTLVKGNVSTCFGRRLWIFLVNPADSWRKRLASLLVEVSQGFYQSQPVLNEERGVNWAVKSNMLYGIRIPS